MSRSRPVTIVENGVEVTYPSRKAFAEARGVSGAAVRHAELDGRLETVGLPESRARIGNGRGGGKPYTLDGVTYPSKAEASRRTGVPYQKL